MLKRFNDPIFYLLSLKREAVVNIFGSSNIHVFNESIWRLKAQHVDRSEKGYGRL